MFSVVHTQTNFSKQIFEPEIKGMVSRDLGPLFFSSNNFFHGHDRYRHRGVDWIHLSNMKEIPMSSHISSLHCTLNDCPFKGSGIDVRIRKSFTMTP